MSARPHRRDRRPATLLILVPGLLGGLHLYERNGSSKPRHVALVDDPGLLRLIVAATDRCAVVLCGTRYTQAVVAAVRGTADVIVVPIPWLRHVPRHRYDDRAGLAARLVTAHRAGPIMPIYGWDQLTLPF